MILIPVAAALGLLIVLYVRQTKTLEKMRDDLNRVTRMQRDSAADVRQRIEARDEAVQALEARLAPLSEAQDHVAGLRDTLDGMRAEVGTLGSRLGEVENQGQGAAQEVATARGEWARIEALVTQGQSRLQEVHAKHAREEQHLAELQAAVATLRERIEGGMEGRIEEQATRLARLEASAEAPPAVEEIVLTPEPEAPDPPKESEAPKEPTPTVDPHEPVPVADEAGANWIFLVLAVLLGLALVAQYIRQAS